MCWPQPVLVNRQTGKRADRLTAEGTGQLTGMVNMLLPAKWARFIQRHFRIQHLVAGLVGYHTPVFHDTEIRTLEHLVKIWTDKTEFHFSILIPKKIIRPQTCKNQLEVSWLMAISLRDLEFFIYFIYRIFM